MRVADTYDLLQVERGADKHTINKAYYKKARQFHPDKNNGCEEAAAIFRKYKEAQDELHARGQTVLCKDCEVTKIAAGKYLQTMTEIASEAEEPLEFRDYIINTLYDMLQ